jgi:hypothetical protein
MDKVKALRQYISNFVKGENVDALLGALGDSLQSLEDLSIAVNDQLTISTASGVYLDKRLSELGITRPAELGMDDLAFRKMGIQINAQKQVTEAIHTVLGTFYGEETVRAFTTSSIAGPYFLEDGDDLIFELEDGVQQTIVINEADFLNVQEATAEELADVITRSIRAVGYDSYALVYLDMDTGLKYIRFFGGAKGPYSFIKILGGKLQSKLEFPDMRGTFVPNLINTPIIWQITRTTGSTHRFRWVGGPQPALDKVSPEDSVLIYGQQLASIGIEGTFTVTGVRPAQPFVSPDAGYFEIELEGYGALKSSTPDLIPPTNTPTDTFSIDISQAYHDDLKFFLPKKNTPYSNTRYALAWEPAINLLRVYMPATTKVVRREIIGAAHLHLLYLNNELNGSFTDIEILSDRSFRYPQNGYDVIASGGTVTHGSNTYDIEYIFRENFMTTVVLTPETTHSLTGTLDEFGRLMSTEVVSISVPDMPQDDYSNPYKGPYILDPAAEYTLTDKFVKLREDVIGGQTKNTIVVEGVLPNEAGILLFSLNKDDQEGPVRYLATQTASDALPNPIVSISQFGTTVTVTTTTPHGAAVGEMVVIAGTANFDGSWEVTSTPSSTVYKFIKTPAATLFENTGTSTTVVNGVLSTLVLDPSYVFQNTHRINDDVTLISDDKVYEPRADGSDYGPYVTGTAEGQAFAEKLIKQITALGINLEIVIVYPDDIGLGNEGGSASLSEPPTSDKLFVWGV